MSNFWFGIEKRIIFIKITLLFKLVSIFYIENFVWKFFLWTRGKERKFYQGLGIIRSFNFNKIGFFISIIKFSFKLNYYFYGNEILFSTRNRKITYKGNLPGGVIYDTVCNSIHSFNFQHYSIARHFRVIFLHISVSPFVQISHITRLHVNICSQ